MQLECLQQKNLKKKNYFGFYSFSSFLVFAAFFFFLNVEWMNIVANFVCVMWVSVYGILFYVCCCKYTQIIYDVVNCKMLTSHTFAYTNI